MISVNWSLLNYLAGNIWNVPSLFCISYWHLATRDPLRTQGGIKRAVRMGKVSFSCLEKRLLHLVGFISTSLSLSQLGNWSLYAGLRVCHLVSCFAWLQNFIPCHFSITKLLFPYCLCWDLSIDRIPCDTYAMFHTKANFHRKSEVASRACGAAPPPWAESPLSTLDAGPQLPGCQAPEGLLPSVTAPRWPSPFHLSPNLLKPSASSALLLEAMCLGIYLFHCISIFPRGSWREALGPINRWLEKKAMFALQPPGLASRKRVWLFTALQGTAFWHDAYAYS